LRRFEGVVFGFGLSGISSKLEMLEEDRCTWRAWEKLLTVDATGSAQAFLGVGHAMPLGGIELRSTTSGVRASSLCRTRSRLGFEGVLIFGGIFFRSKLECSSLENSS